MGFGATWEEVMSKDPCSKLLEAGTISRTKRHWKKGEDQLTTVLLQSFVHQGERLFIAGVCDKILKKFLWKKRVALSLKEIRTLPST